jgi:hypothetical protein
MFGHHTTTIVGALALAALAAPARGGATSSFADLPDGVFIEIGLGNPVGPFGPFDFDFGAGHIVTATLDASAMSCPDNIGSFGEPISHPNDPLVDPGDHQGRYVVNSASCPDQSITLDFSEPVLAVGVTFKHYSCGFLQQGDRTIQAFDGPGGTGNLIGTALTEGYAIRCFSIWLDFVGVVSDQADIQSMVILADSDETLITGIAASPGAPAPCPADLDGDGEVGVTDFLDLLAAWGPNPGHPADLDGDGIVGVTDFLTLLADWGSCP